MSRFSDSIPMIPPPPRADLNFFWEQAVILALIKVQARRKGVGIGKRMTQVRVLTGRRGCGGSSRLVVRGMEIGVGAGGGSRGRWGGEID
ncbi:hypothetical protein E2562_023306 [Oryza meyeriana var. granulata]|uniref:Uncharacterized protein n=1 Tax=Oryza meyeriana var. granulata TaxID=110450 RepID=A0A6G1DPH7_9ORYZ|nr:hypothetical protein E2562_023306 [Oryza meyeriana var. granulata]